MKLHAPLLACSLPAFSLLAASAHAKWSTATLSQARHRIAATSVGDLALFAGGTIPATGPTDVVDLYDASTGTWTTSALSTPRELIGATSVAGRAYFAGGSEPVIGAVSTIDVYDVATGTWSITSLSVPRIKVGATTVGQYAVFAGGSDDSFTLWSDVVDVFDSSTGLWSTATLPIFMPFATAVSVGDRALVFSDFGSQDLVLFDPATGLSDVVDRPDALINQVLVAVAGAPGRFWLAGGANSFFPQSTLGEVHEYDVATGTWSVSPLAEARGGIGAARTSTKLVLAGGFIGSTALDATAAVDVFDLVDGSRTTASLATPRTLATAVEVGGRLLFAGGLEGPVTGTQTPSAAVDIYDDRLGTTYCAPAVPNSTGAPAEIRVEGVPGTVALGRVTLVGTDLPLGSAGYFVTSKTQDLVPGAGGSQGTLCIGGAVGRYATSVFVAPFGGQVQLTIDLLAMPSPTGTVPVLPGETWNFQAWYRDANPTATTNFTSAVAVTFR
ncbi:MAG: hypothetical protein AAGI22_16905 [Planctomycetota bacterium]